MISVFRATFPNTFFLAIRLDIHQIYRLPNNFQHVDRLRINSVTHSCSTAVHVCHKNDTTLSIASRIQNMRKFAQSQSVSVLKGVSKNYSKVTILWWWWQHLPKNKQ